MVSSRIFAVSAGSHSWYSGIAMSRLIHNNGSNTGFDPRVWPFSRGQVPVDTAVHQVYKVAYGSRCTRGVPIRMR